ncbi:integrase, catalytic region, zinc finger, CCHC-type containing protein [Tanacetum coccineum]
MSQDVLLTVMNSMSLIGESVNMDGKRKESCNLEAELLKSQNAFNDLLKRYSQLERHCISLESSIQLNQAIFQKDESCDNLNAFEIPEFFENNDLKAQLQDKDTTVYNLGSTKIVLSEDKAVEEDSSKQGRSLIEELNIDAEISLVPPHDAEIQEKISNDTEVLLEEEETVELVEEPTKLVEDQGSGKKGEQEVTTGITHLNTASVPISTASATPEVSTTVKNLVYIRRSAEKKKDKGKAIMIEDESVQKKSKKQLEQERLSHEEAIRLQEQIDEEERKRIARDAEIAKQLQEEYDKAGKKEVVAEVDTAHVIDWNDPSVIRYHALQHRPRSVAEVRKNMIMYLKNQGGYKMKDFKGMSYDDIRPIFKKVWDQFYSFVPMDSEEEVQRLKRAGQDVEAKPAKRQRTEEVSESVQEQTDELSQEQLNQMVIIVPDEGINVEALQTKYPIIGWEVYSEDTMQFWKIIKLENLLSLGSYTKRKSAENEDLKAQIQDKVFVITSLKNDLQKVKGKEIVDNAAQIPSANTILLGMFKLDLEPLAPRLLQNREVHIEYLKYTQEQADILREYAKKVVVTPKNKVKKVRIAEPLTSSSNIKQVESSKTSDSNTHGVVHFYRLKCSTSKCGSKPACNKKNDRISQTTSKNMKNKVEAQPRKVNKKNHVVEPIHDINVNHSLLNANFEPICANCKKSMFDGVHDMCILDFVENDIPTSASLVMTVVPFVFLVSGTTDVWKHMNKNLQRPSLRRAPVPAPPYNPPSALRSMNFISKALGIVRFDKTILQGIMGYVDYQLEMLLVQGIPTRGLTITCHSDLTICDAELRVCISENACFFHNLRSVDLLSEARDTNLYQCLLMTSKTSLICLLSKASKTKSWLWYRRLSHLNFGTINKLDTDGLARGIPRLKFQKDHLCSACALGKSKKSSPSTESETLTREAYTFA